MTVSNEHSDAVPAPTFTRSLATRALWLVALLASWPVVALSFWLRPDPRGFGTHQQLGLPPCNFQEATHIPCPGCGLTTSFTNMAHGHVIDAFAAHLMGPLLFLITVGVALASPWALRTALPVDRVLGHRATVSVLSVTLALGLVTFAMRLGRTFLH
ncbi:MAG: DUF2752 domain-containing protein [Polyangiales bacterium]